MYGGNGISDSERDRGGGVGGSNCYSESTDFILDSLPDLYSKLNVFPFVTNFIQLISPQPVDRFSQTKLRWKAPNEGYPHICGMYKSNNERLRYQAISSCKSFVC